MFWILWILKLVIAASAVIVFCWHTRRRRRSCWTGRVAAGPPGNSPAPVRRRLQVSLRRWWPSVAELRFARGPVVGPGRRRPARPRSAGTQGSSCSLRANAWPPGRGLLPGATAPVARSPCAWPLGLVGVAAGEFSVPRSGRWHSKFQNDALEFFTNFKIHRIQNIL